MNSSSILAPDRPPRRSAHTTTRYVRTLLLALLLALCLLLPTLAPAQPLLAQGNGDPPPFACQDGTAFLFQNDPTDVFTVDLITGAANEVASDITPGSLTINGIGFNQTDGYIWGSVQTSSGRIARIGADYVPQYFDIPGLPRDYNAGDVSADGLLYLYTAAVNSTAIYVVDVDPASPTYLTLLSTLPGANPPGARVFDFAISPIDGNIYGVSDKTSSANAKLQRFDPTTGIRSEVGEITGADINATVSLFGAVYFSAEGDLYASANTTGRIYRIGRPDLLTGGGVTATLFSQGPAPSFNDGARCSAAPLPNALPTATDDDFTTIVGTQVTGNVITADNGNGVDSDPDTDPLTVTEVNGTAITSGGTITLPSGATLVMNSDGSFTYDDNGATGPDSFTYTIDDGSGGTDTATVTITVDPPPFTCSDGTAFLFQRNPTDVFTVDLITGAGTEVASDITPAGSPINGIGFNQTDGYIWGSVENPSGSGRIARVGADYVPQYFDIPGLPARSYNAGDVSADGLLHLYNDGVGTTIYVIDVNPNRPATYLTVTTLTTTKANGAIVDLAFSPIDGNIYAISSATNTSNLQLHRFDSTTGVRTNLGDVTGGDINATPSNFGAVYFAADGNFYVSANVTGRIYRIERPDLLTGGGVTATFFAPGPPSNFNDGARCSVAPLQNAPPVATDDDFTTTVGTQVTGNVISGDNGNGVDSDPDTDPLTVTEVNGQAITPGGTINLPSGATLVMNSDGSFTYDDNGATALGSPDSFTYTIDDGNGGTDTATVAVTVNPPAFVCSDGTAFLFQRVPTDVFELDLLTGNDTQVASDITSANNQNINAIGFNQTDGYIWGSLSGSTGTIARVGADYVPQYFDITGLPSAYSAGDVSADGKLYLYSPLAGTAIYVVDVDPASPTYLTLLSTLPSTRPAGAGVFDFAISPIDGNIYGVSEKTDSTNAKLQRFDPATGARSEVGEITGADINTTNSLFGAVYFSAEGDLYASANTGGRIYRIERPDLLTSGGVTTTLFSVGPESTQNDGARCSAAPLPNDPPVAVDDTETTLINTPVNVDVRANDTDGEDASGRPEGAITITTPPDPAQGTATVNDGGTPDDPSDDTVDFTPALGFTGDATFQYTINDANSETSNVATVTVTVDPPLNTTPVAVDDTESTPQDTPVNVDVRANDIDLEDANLTPQGAITISTPPNPAQGTATINDGGTPGDPSDDTIDFTPAAGFTGPATFSYQICDAGTPPLCDTADVTVTVQPDTDGDGIPDDIDIDDDNDGIPDTVELATAPPNGDTDGDGIIDSLDLDSDNDGISDIQESGLTPDQIAALDTNGDGVIDVPVGANGLADAIESDDTPAATITYNGGAPADTDGDGQPDFQDLDADNDGINDLVEGGLDPAVVDTDRDGVLDDPLSDDDGDGIPNIVDDNPAAFGGEQAPLPDTDGDGVPDWRDLDSDNDGINDIIEGGLDDPDGDGLVGGPDTDGDGIRDAADEAPTVYGDANSGPHPDTDGDGVPDYLDLDSDNDGINDVIEGSPTGANLDPDGNGVVDGPDADGDGIQDPVDKAPNTFGDADEPVPPDTDGDTVPDFRDLDSDNDGVNDVVEGGYDDLDTDNDGLIDGPDSDGDGINDPVDGDNGTFGDANDPTPPNSDNDPVPDYRDLDSDNDNINDIEEAGIPDPNGNGLVDGPDMDGDGIKDAVDGDPATFGDANDPLEPDSDNNGTPDRQQPDFPASGGDPALDGDNDGVIDDPTDGDGDGIPDVVDGGPGDFGDLPDNDGDGIPDDIDIDDDNDGIPDTVELATAPANGDTDGDGIPDPFDLDSDGDGISDLDESGLTPEEIAALDTNGDGVIDPNQPFGPNGLADNVETTPESGQPDYNNDGQPDAPQDTDGDGVPDFQDLDSDNDGINDLIEGGQDPAVVDPDGNGVIEGPDNDGDGIPDVADANDTRNGGLNAPLPDTDGDGVPDWRDLDSDNDGVNDIIEGGLEDPNGDGLVDGPDTDGDGINDAADEQPNGYGDANSGPAPDTDDDGTPDYQDLDSDNDGVNDVDEGGNGDLDTNDDGVIDGPDADGDGIQDSVDGAPDTFGDANDPVEPDTDGDGVPDRQDLDSDNDGVNDVDEGGNGAFDTDTDGVIDGPDTDGDGINDPVDGAPNDFGDANDPDEPDTDGDNVPDRQDLDSDNDGVNDVDEGGNGDLDTDDDGVIDGPDSDGDGIQDSVDGAPNDFGDANDPDEPDTNGNGTPDRQDLDSDGDDINDVVEGGNGDLDANGDGVVDGPDSDGDGIIDAVDDAPSRFGDANDPDEPDTNGNGVPDRLEPPQTRPDEPDDPKPVVLVSFTAAWQGDGVEVEWLTSAEIDTVGFHLFRSTTGGRASAERMTERIIISQGPDGGVYRFSDRNVEPGMTYIYWLVETTLTGETIEYGPVSTSGPATGEPNQNGSRTFLPLINNR